MYCNYSVFSTLSDMGTSVKDERQCRFALIWWEHVVKVCETNPSADCCTAAYTFIIIYNNAPV